MFFEKLPRLSPFGGTACPDRNVSGGRGLPYLGNITHQVNTSNVVVTEYNFDAWGRRRSADDWSYTMDANDLALFADRGFTGHEYLPYFSLYNMNGRMYDPLVGRFLSADPIISNGGYTQSYNRYSYCLNNPLRFTDPSGYTYKPTYWDEAIGGGGVPVRTYGRYDFSGVNARADSYFGIERGANGNYLFNSKNDIITTNNRDVINAVAYAYNSIYGSSRLSQQNWDNSLMAGGPGIGQSSGGHIVSVANGTVALGPVGATADLGAVFDGYGKAQMYFTFGWAYGFGATAGVGYSQTNKGFKVTDYAGSASAVMLSIPFTPFGVEGFGDYYQGATEVFHIGTKTKKELEGI